MKPRSFFILFVMALCCVVLPVSASRLGDIRMNARFLTDRMAYELRLSHRQYNDIFEINYDFFYNVDPYIDRMSYGDPYALDVYYRFLDERNDDIRWVLSRKNYVRFMGLEHFFLPIYAVNHVCYIRIYNIYPNRTYFYYARPSHYYSYRGGHCRHQHGGISFYQRNHRKHYNHSVYNGRYQSVRTQTRGRDFPTGSLSERPTHSNRRQVVSDRTRFDSTPAVGSVSHRSESVNRRSEPVRRSESVRHRSESVNHRSESVNHRSESVNHRSESVRRSTDSSRSRAPLHDVSQRQSRYHGQTGQSTRSEHSERRRVRER